MEIRKGRLGRRDYLCGVALFTWANALWTALVDPVRFDRVLAGYAVDA